MKRLRLDPAELSRSYGIQMDTIPSPDHGVPGLGAAWAVIEPGQSTMPHRHDEHEAFVILRGKGQIRVGEETAEVRAGDLVMLEPFERHVLTCQGPGELAFVDLYWRDKLQAATAPAMATGQPVFVLSMPPTPNGDLHLGHISGPYLAADACVRFLRMTGVRAFHVTGSDDYQSFVDGKAAALGSTPPEVADRYSAEIRATLAALDIEPDQFTRPLHDPGYAAFVRRFVDTLIARGHLRLGVGPGLVGRDSGTYHYEWAVQGRCPTCGSSTTGNICEDCAMPNRCVDLIDARATFGEPLLATPVRRWEFALSEHADFLREHFDTAVMTGRLRVLLEQILARFDRVAVSHPATYGLPAPDVEGQVIWVWLEMAAGYLFGVDAVRRRHGLPAPENPLEGALAVNFFGIDNAFYVTVLHSIAYAGAFEGQKLDASYVCNEFYLFDRRKFSTSRDHAVWGRQLLDEASPDDIRFYLASTRPEGERSNFDLEEFRRASQSWRELWVQALGAVRSALGPIEETEDPTDRTLEQSAFQASLSRYPAKLAACYAVKDFSLRRAARALSQLAEEILAFACAEGHWARLAPGSGEHRTAAALLLAGLRLLALLSAPLMPRRAQALWRDLGLDGEVGRQDWPEGLEILPAGLRPALLRQTQPPAMQGSEAA